MDFNFVHAADLHLDSPLRGLTRKSPDYAERVSNASREAFDNLIELTIEEKCPFLLIAGDVFDGDWKEYTTGHFFLDRMRKLRDANIEAFIILGNHDAENELTSRLTFSENVHLFSHKKPESKRVTGMDVTVHGQSFPSRDVVDNLAKDYPLPEPNHFNIGLLHTACTGRAGHEPYAPCTVEQLENHGYDYWALGHVHSFEIVSDNPYIVFPGNLQGRHARETGPKGAALVRVRDSKVEDVSHKSLDTVRWENEKVDLSGVDDAGEANKPLLEAIRNAYSNSDGRSLALRMELTGETPLHDELIIKSNNLREEIETLAANIAGDIWIEKVIINTSMPGVTSIIDPSIAKEIANAVDDPIMESQLLKLVEDKLSEIATKFPRTARQDELFEKIRLESVGRAKELARSIINSG